MTPHNHHTPKQCLDTLFITPFNFPCFLLHPTVVGIRTVAAQAEAHPACYRSLQASLQDELALYALVFLGHHAYQRLRNLRTGDLQSAPASGDLPSAAPTAVNPQRQTGIPPALRASSDRSSGPRAH